MIHDKIISQMCLFVGVKSAGPVSVLIGTAISLEGDRTIDFIICVLFPQGQFHNAHTNSITFVIYMSRGYFGILGTPEDIPCLLVTGIGECSDTTVFLIR